MIRITVKSSEHNGTNVCFKVHQFVFKKLKTDMSPLCCAGDLHMAGTSTRENGLKETITLKWCTPRTNSIGGQFLLVQFLFN